MKTVSRWRFNSALSVDDCAELASLDGYIDFAHPLVGGLVDRILEVAAVESDPPAYARVEARSEGHPWHVDTGTKGHMGWCRMSGSIVLTPPESFSGGGFYFSDSTEPIVHYRDFIVYDDHPSNRHCVTRSRGDRRALIMFFRGGDNG